MADLLLTHIDGSIVPWCISIPHSSQVMVTAQRLGRDEKNKDSQFIAAVVSTSKMHATIRGTGKCTAWEVCVRYQPSSYHSSSEPWLESLSTSHCHSDHDYILKRVKCNNLGLTTHIAANLCVWTAQGHTDLSIDQTGWPGPYENTNIRIQSARKYICK